MEYEEVPVLVVGAGPVGLSTGLFLAHQGVRPLVIDKRDPTQAPPRAGISPRTLELYRAVGLETALGDSGWRSPGTPMGSAHTDAALTGEIRRTGAPPAFLERLTAATPVDLRTQASQLDVEQVAMTEFTRLGGELRTGVELIELDPASDRVRAVVADTETGVRREISAAYVVAADGANSPIRAGLGITVPDRQVVARLNTAFFRADLGSVIDRWGSHGCLVRNDDVYAAIFSRNGKDQWSTHLMDYPGKPPGVTELSVDRTIELLHAAFGDSSVAIDLLAVNGWEAAIGAASAFRSGRVFLVGDAAHVQSSAGGLGMNTGIQDGHNLAWKLAAVLSGSASPALLDSYEPERRTAVAASLAYSRAMHEGYRALEDPAQMFTRMSESYLSAMMAYRYDTGTFVRSDETPPTDLLTTRAIPGARFPHLEISPPGRGLSTLDLIAYRWTLLTGPEGQRWLAAAESVLADGIDLRAHSIGLDTFTDDIGVSPTGAVLIRPDGIVAWRAPDDSVADSLHATIRQLLTGRRTSAGRR